MRIEVSIAKTTALPNGALEALNNELSRRIEQQFPAHSSQVTVRLPPITICRSLAA
jgi:DNA-damage-inducible protein I